MSTKHTPGPWTIDYCGQTKTARGIRAALRNIVNSNGLSAPMSAETAANARLIAAAPDLLEALQAICDEQDAQQGYATYEAYDKARAAIAKATREQQ